MYVEKIDLKFLGIIEKGEQEKSTYLCARGLGPDNTISKEEEASFQSSFDAYKGVHEQQAITRCNIQQKNGHRGISCELIEDTLVEIC